MGCDVRKCSSRSVVSPEPEITEEGNKLEGLGPTFLF